MISRTFKVTGEHAECVLQVALKPSEMKQLSEGRVGDEANPLGVHQISKI